jgi:diacylglycerol kinase (ATP)
VAGGRAATGPRVSDRPAVFLVNPASANGRTGKTWPALRRRAEELGLRGEPLLSERRGHLVELARDAAAEGRLLVVVGGDGTLNEVVNGIAGRDVDLATIPLGTGMDFGRTYGIPTKFDDAVRLALDGAPRTIDAGRVRYRTWGGEDAERWFVNVGSVGMSGAVAQRANGMSKALGGKATFFYALTRVFFEWENTEVTVQFDGGERRGRMHDVVVANGVWHGGGMKLAPDAQPDDGLFDVVLIGDVGKVDFLTTAPKIYKGKHVAHPKVEVVRSARVAVDAAEHLPIEVEGEQVGTTPAVFELVPGALRVRVPA